MLLNSDKKFVKNYFTNPRAENGVYSWNLYNDGAAARPVDGTGGTPSGNFGVTTSASAPIEGARSLHLVKAASNMQGYGFSTDMAIDLTLQGKMCQIRFDYRIVSGTFAGSGVNTTDSDLIVYFYDVTNSALIEPSCIVMDGTNTGLTFTYKGNIQIPTNCASLRFIVHCATTSASAYTLDFDNFSLSEQIAIQGAPVSDWKTYTPVLSWVSGVTSSEGWWRRVGDSMECKTKIVTSGAVTAAILTIGLPLGYTIDTTKLPSAGINGCVFLDGEIGYARRVSPGEEGVSSVIYASTTTVNPVVLSAGSTNVGYNFVTNTAPWTWANTDSLVITFKVPILGWGTSTSISGVDAADGRLVAFKAYRNAAFTTLDPNASWKQIPFDAVLHDSHLSFNTTTFRYICPVSGTYSFNSGIDIASTNVLANIYAIGLYKNGSLVETAELSTKIVTTRFKAIGAFSPQKSIAGDYFEIFLYGAGNNGTNKLTITEGVEVTYFGGYRLPSTTSISSGETVACRYSSSSGQLIPSSLSTSVEFTTKTYDTHGMSSGSGATWKLTVPISGKYRFSFSFMYETRAITTALSAIAIIAVTSGNQTYFTYLVQANNTNNAILHGTDTFNFNAGNTLQVFAYQDTATAWQIYHSNDVNNFISLERIGA